MSNELVLRKGLFVLIKAKMSVCKCGTTVLNYCSYDE